MLRICPNRHLTGYRTCPMCGNRDVTPLANTTREDRLPLKREEVLVAVASSPRQRPSLAAMFRVWRARHQQKIVLRRAGKVAA